MATKIETLERVLYQRLLLSEGKADKMQEVLDEVIEEARSARNKERKQADE